MVHTPAYEPRSECDLVEHETGMRNIIYLDSVGLTGRHVALAHCIHVDEQEMQILKRTQTNVVHCPSSNLKLGSGIAPITKMLETGISVSLGADGAACNNRLDMFTEMRTAALLQKVLHGPEAIPASRALRMATIDGARAIGIGDEIGSIETGKRANLILVNLARIELTPPSVHIVSGRGHSWKPADVGTVTIKGQLVKHDGKLLTVDEQRVIENANLE